MKTHLLPAIIAFLLLGCQVKPQKPTLRQADFYTEDQGKAELAKLEKMYTTKAEWETRKALLKTCILEGMNLSPLPKRTPLNAVIGEKRVYDGYSVENVYFESIPGFYLCGNLYRPLDQSVKHPAVLCPHGHFGGKELGDFGRFRPDQQKRCATFARMGAVVFSYNMFAYGENIRQLNDSAVIEKPNEKNIGIHNDTPLALTMQTWNSIRALDFLETLPEVDLSKIAVTGASGGGTQTFLLAALDDRISVSIPVVMVSCYFYGGCGCESGLPIHQSTKHFTNNAEIASMIAPKPLLMISDGSDWTKNEPLVEFPFIKRTFGFYGAEDKVENVHFANAKHNYNAEKRVPVYAFLAKHLGLNLAAVSDSSGLIDESKSVLEPAESLLSFSSQKPLPANALFGLEAIENALKSLQKK